MLEALQPLSAEEQRELLKALQEQGSDFSQLNFGGKNFQVSVEPGGTANNAETININNSLKVDAETLKQALGELVAQQINQRITGDGNQGIGQMSGNATAIGAINIHPPSSAKDAEVSPPFYYPSDRGSTTFVGRGEELERLRELLNSSERVAIAAATGMGGIGKTELAWQYARQCERDGSYPAGIWWLGVRGANLSSQILSHSLRMGLGQPPDELLEEAEKVQWCFDRWGQALEGKRLLILDDATDYLTIRALLPQDERYHVLLTTRRQLGQPVKRLDLGVLKRAAAFRLLRQLVDDDERIKAELKTAVALCDWLGRLPLGIELVGRYLARKPDMSFVMLLGRLEKQKLQALALRKVPDEMAYQLPLEAAIELSWQALGDEAQELGCLLSLFALAPIPWRLVEGCDEQMDAEELGELRDEELLGGSLLERSGPGEYQLHQVIREALVAKRKQWDGAETMQHSWAEVLLTEAKQVPLTPTVSVQEQMAAVIPHLEELAQIGQDWLGDEDATWPHCSLGRLYEGQSLWLQAEHWLSQSVEVSEQRFGPEHLSTASSLNNLATLYELQGRYSDAEPLYERALAIYASQLGPEHLFTASSLNNLAGLYRSQGRYSDAEPLLKRALAITESQLGPEHLSTALSLNNLAELYRSQGLYSEAEPLSQRALMIYDSQLGAEHPSTASSLNNLALLYRSQGRYSDAEPLLKRALAIRESQLGPEHPYTALSLNNLAALNRSQGRYSDAEPLYERALAIYESQLGPEHPDTASSLNNLAFLYRSQGRYSDAEPLYEKALAITESQLGPEHPNNAVNLNNLAGLYDAQGRYSDAEPLYERALAITESQLGPEHPYTQTVQRNWSELVSNAVENCRAQELSDHPMTQKILELLKQQQNP